MLTEPKSYRIATLDDFLAVPEDRLAACLEEFADWCEVSRRTEAVLRTLVPDHPADKPLLAALAFEWTDDGARHVTMSLSFAAGDSSVELARVEWPEGGPVSVIVAGAVAPQGAR